MLDDHHRLHPREEREGKKAVFTTKPRTGSYPESGRELGSEDERGTNGKERSYQALDRPGGRHSPPLPAAATAASEALPSAGDRPPQALPVVLSEALSSSAVGRTRSVAMVDRTPNRAAGPRARLSVSFKPIVRYSLRSIRPPSTVLLHSKL